MIHLLSVAPVRGLGADMGIEPRVRCVHPGLRAAARLAGLLELDPLDPVGSLASQGIGLRVVVDRLVTRSREILGLWDPTLRRIELFGCNQGRGDRELVFSLAHEWAHATDSASEAEADDRARRFVEALNVQATAACAATLRRLAVSTPPADQSETGSAGIPL